MIREELAQCNPDAIVYDGLDDCLIGIGHRCSQNGIAIYSYNKMVNHFMSHGMSYEEAVEYIDFNILGGWLGEYTPLVLQGEYDD